MFRSKRDLLVKHILKLVLLEENHETECSVETNSTEFKGVACKMFSRLKEEKLSEMRQALSKKESERSNCVLIPNENIKIGRLSMAPNVFCCKLWRWPDLDSSSQLKRLDRCENPCDTLYICCNPYHWSRILVTETSPPAYSSVPPDVYLNRGMEENVESVATGLTEEYPFTASPESPWCKVSYWEHVDRVGRPYHVWDKSFRVFCGECPQGDGGLCLQTLAASNRSSTDERVLRVRNKIGNGLVMFREGNQAWLYNCSEFPLFVNSGTLDEPFSPHLTLFKLHPGWCMRAYDGDRAAFYRTLLKPSWFVGPPPHDSIRVSFAKGWGTNYTRQCINACPCWIEMSMNVHHTS